MSTPATDPNAAIAAASMPGVAQTPDAFVVFSLFDADGAPHRYEVRPHPPTEGTGIVFRLIALGAEPFAAVIASAFAMEEVMAGVSKVGDLLDLDLGVLAAKVDWSGVGRDVKGSILSMPMGALVRDILRHTWRDGKPLSNDVFYNEAYARNYTELLRAVWEVAGANRFFPQLSTSETEGGETRTPG